MLYRAATKTYHSHLILRRLFHVHSALAEFDLAVKALDSYIEIVLAAKERAEKGAELGELEKDETLLQTLSEGIALLSCLGSFAEAEKAKNLTELVREYIDKQVAGKENDKIDGKLLLSQGPNSSNCREIPLTTLATAYRAVGMGLATWAYHTPLNEARDEIRAEAIQYLENSIAPELGDPRNYSSLYTLSIALAENRDLDTAINYVKFALGSHGSHPDSEDLFRERDLVPLWHLLALLLSAKQDFDIAERSCEAAFEQFPAEIFTKNRGPARRASRNSQFSGPPKRTLVSRLSGREKERILETRITQVAFTEILEGPEAAVNQSDRLLGLFSTLFHDFNLDGEGRTKTSKPEHLVPPKSSAGTTKSFRSSIFHRNRTSQLPERRADPNDSKPSTPTPPVPTIPNGHSPGADAPAIQVTDEDTHAHSDRASTIGRSDSKRLKKRSSSFIRNERPRGQEPHLPNGAESPDMVGVALSGNASPVSANHPATGKQSLPPVVHNMHHMQQPLPVGHKNQPPVHDVRFPGTAYHRFDSPSKAITKFSIAQSEKHALGLLIKVWLIIAGMYRRASLFDDAREACEEAKKQVVRVESVTASLESSAQAFSKRGWTAAKSSDELWADVYAEQGMLNQAQSDPHQAIKSFEEALLRQADHPTATIGLANLLLDIWDQKLPLETAKADSEISTSRLSLLTETPKPKTGKAVSIDELKASEAVKPEGSTEGSASAHDVDPKHLHRLAARDRAYGLLSALTKRGSSWDSSEAWYALSRAYEAGEQVEKLKEVLWWCIELEDRRPIRHWSNIGSGLYVL
jgi:tetratricopeptide (TPR) repeat protein